MIAEKKPKKIRATTATKKPAEKAAAPKIKVIRKTTSKEAVPTVKIKKPRLAKVSKVATKTADLAVQTINQSVTHDFQGTETKVEDSKYFTGLAEQKFIDRSFDLPENYGQTQIVLMVRDPYWVFTYWEITQSSIDEIVAKIGAEVFSASKQVLRVFNVDNWDFFDIETGGFARDWYIKVPTVNASYCVEVGYRTPDGRFIACARSNIVTTPLDRMSDEVDEQWMVPDWDKIYSLSGGFGLGKSSGEIRELMKKRLEGESASGWVSSLSSPSQPPAKRPFWMWVKTDLILYGATEPSATLTVQGKKVDLRADGTFSLRFSLPDGKQDFPVEAIRDDGKEKKSAHIKTERKSK